MAVATSEAGPKTFAGDPQLRSVQPQVTAPELEVQPWVRDLQAFLQRTTYGTLRIDLARPTWTKAGTQRPQLRTSQPVQPWRRGQVAQPPPGHARDEAYQFQQPETVFHGAQVKAMRCAAFGPILPTGRRLVDVGIGGSLHTQGVSPVFRVRLLDAIRFKFLPLEPILKLKHTFPIFDTGLAVHAAYVQPMMLKDLRNVGKYGAWNISLGRVGPNRVVFSPDRIEVSNQRLQLGENVNLHVNGEICYPRNIPQADWVQQFNFLPSRICVKVAW